MPIRKSMLAIVACEVLAFCLAPAADRATDAAPPAPPRNRVYGEWRICVKPDKGSDYNALIKSRGLPLFRQAGGRMVGWWTTLVGNLYEQLTIWEYDDMAAFERAVAFLGRDKRFAEFVALRDPLLSGEQNRFLALAEGAEPPTLADPAKLVIHEIHRVSQAKMAEYLRFMTNQGMKLLKAHGFRPAGPWTVDIGNWSEVTYLFRFDSLDERRRLIAQFSAHDDAKTYGAAIGKFVESITTRVLVPAPFAGRSPQHAATTSQRRTLAQTPVRSVSSTLLPHVVQLADGVFATGFADRFGSSNCGWIRMPENTLLIDVPRGVRIAEFLAEVERIAGKPVRTLALTSAESVEPAEIDSLLRQGVTEIVASSSVAERLGLLWNRKYATKRLPVQKVDASRSIGDETVTVNYMPLDVSIHGSAIVHLPQAGVLFTGPLVVNGPRTPLAGKSTERWIAALKTLERLHPAHVVPGAGSWGGPSIIRRERRFLTELRRQIGYLVCQGRSQSFLKSEVRIPAEDLVWMPYDTPTSEDLEHVYRELTVPIAPFDDRLPDPADPKPHALVLIGDQPHEPGHILEGLAPVFEATGVVPHFTVDVRSLTAENLSKVRLLVILRDGLQRPTDDPSSHYAWMTADQQAAVERFVVQGAAFLNLHNSMGLFPDDGPYLKLVGGRYIGHGPLERFRVEVVDPEHPITRGVRGFSVADEQHTPPYDAQKVHLLLRNRSDDGKTVAAAGWAYEPGRGRLCHLANGHTRESLLHPMYQRLLRNAVNWCLRRNVGGPAKNDSH